MKMLGIAYQTIDIWVRYASPVQRKRHTLYVDMHCTYRHALYVDMHCTYRHALYVDMHCT